MRQTITESLPIMAGVAVKDAVQKNGNPVPVPALLVSQPATVQDPE